LGSERRFAGICHSDENAGYVGDAGRIKIRLSAQLAVLAGTSIDCRMRYRLVPLRLTVHARAYAGKRLTSPIRYAVTAIFALVGSLAARHACSSCADGVADGIVDLILHRAIS
jgi:hypothetical protein